MTNNFDEFDQHDMGLPEETPAPRGVGGNLTEAWRSKPLFKLMVLMVGVAAVVAVSVSLFSGNKSEDHSKLVNPPDMHEAPGGSVSPYMKQQTDLANKSRAEEALQTGGSALPTPTGLTSDIDLGKKDEALSELKSETEQLKQQLVEVQKQAQQAQQQQRPQAPQPQAAKPEPFDDSLAQAMQIQMKSLTDSWAPHGMKEVEGAKPEDRAASATSAANGAAPGANGDTSAPPAVAVKDIVTAGTVSYAQLLTEANSDVPGPILAQILSGPLAGARAVGSFQTKNEYLVLQFTNANLKGVDYNISAVALDPDTTLGGLATEVDERYFTRVLLPAASAFLQGLGSGLGQGNSSITTNGTTSITTYANQGFRQGAYQGLGSAAQTAGQFFQNQANLTKVLVRVASGTPIGLFFTKSVQNTAAQDNALAAQNARNAYNNYNNNNNNNYNNGANGYNGNGFNGNNANGTGYQPSAAYPGSTVTGYGGDSSDVPYPNFASSPNGARGNTGYPGVTGASPTYYGH